MSLLLLDIDRFNDIKSVKQSTNTIMTKLIHIFNDLCIKLENISRYHNIVLANPTGNTT